MTALNINRLSELLQPRIGPGKTILSREEFRLTAPGENYGSSLFALQVKVQDGNKTESLDLVAKVPPENQFVVNLFNSPVTFRCELAFYKIIVPLLKEFVAENGFGDDFLDCFADFYGGRLSLNGNEREIIQPNDLADSSAVILLENLKTYGFIMEKRLLGFDLETAKLILTSLAKLHGVTLALKLTKPGLFKNIKQFFSTYTVFDLKKSEEDLEDDPNSVLLKQLLSLVEESEEIKRLAPRVEKVLKQNSVVIYENEKNCPAFFREPFATIVHADAWTNNFLVKFVNNRPVQSKIVDFQLYEYGSPARDVVFFLFTSVQLPVLRTHFDDLVKFYHDCFIDILQKCGCDVEPFSFEIFETEMTVVASQYTLLHCLMMLQPIFAEDEHLKKIEEFDVNDLLGDRPITQTVRERAVFIVDTFAQKNWI